MEDEVYIWFEDGKYHVSEHKPAEGSYVCAQSDSEGEIAVFDHNDEELDRDSD